MRKAGIPPRVSEPTQLGSPAAGARRREHRTFFLTDVDTVFLIKVNIRSTLVDSPSFPPPNAAAMQRCSDAATGPLPHSNPCRNA